MRQYCEEECDKMWQSCEEEKSAMRQYCEDEIASMERQCDDRISEVNLRYEAMKKGDEHYDRSGSGSGEDECKMETAVSESDEDEDNGISFDGKRLNKQREIKGYDPLEIAGYAQVYTEIGGKRMYQNLYAKVNQKQKRTPQNIEEDRGPQPRRNFVT